MGWTLHPTYWPTFHSYTTNIRTVGTGVLESNTNVGLRLTLLLTFEQLRDLDFLLYLSSIGSWRETSVSTTRNQYTPDHLHYLTKK